MTRSAFVFGALLLLAVFVQEGVRGQSSDEFGGADASNATLTGNPNQVVAFADAQWNCANADCSARVCTGCDQPNYACAEFVARSLAAGGYLTISPYASYAAYGSHVCNGQGPFNLRSIASLSSCLRAMGWHAVPASSITVPHMVIGDGGGGPSSHTCIAVGPDLVNCHNIARYHVKPANNLYRGINLVLAP